MRSAHRRLNMGGARAPSRGAARQNRSAGLNATPPRPPGRAAPARSATALWVLGGFVALALLAGAVAGALREPAALDPGAPEGVVQAYLQAIIAGDHETAARHLSEPVARRCRDAFADAWMPESPTARLQSVETYGDVVEVRVEVTSVSGPPPPLGSGQHSFVERFSLAREGGAWRIERPPWPVRHCPELP